MNSYINIHTHSENSNTIEIVNCSPSEVMTFTQKSKKYISIGLHPWHISSNYKDEIAKIILLAKNTQVIAIGETGLDKLCDTNFILQKEIFIAHARLAEALQKPLIIHCVKAHAEIIQIKKELQPTTAWILHGFRGNKALTEQLLSHDFYFSFGKGLKYLEDSVKSIPLGKIFLETDDTTNSIEEGYCLLGDILNKDISGLIDKINTNFKYVFLRK